jgi:hypothetical protein
MHFKRKVALPLIALAAVALTVPASAGAVKKVYPGGKGHTLNGGAGGWSATDSQTGPLGETLCIVAGILICPSSASAVAPDGGAHGAGDGFARSEFSVIVGVAGTGTSVWNSKTFKYRGAKGNKARKIKFRMKRQTDLTELLALPSSGASFTAEIVRGGSSGDVVAIGDGALPASSPWTKLPKVKVKPRALKKGKRYSLRVTTEYETGLAGVVESGTVGYDSPKLVVKGKRKKHRGRH